MLTVFSTQKTKDSKSEIVGKEIQRLETTQSIYTQIRQVQKFDEINVDQVLFI